MTEERETYDLHHDARDGTDGVERIGDILHRLIDERGWPLARVVTRANGHNRDANDELGHGDG